VRARRTVATSSEKSPKSATALSGIFQPQGCETEGLFKPCKCKRENGLL